MKNMLFDRFCETTSQDIIKIRLTRLGYTDAKLCTQSFLKPNKYGKSSEITPTGRPIFAETVEQTTSESLEKDDIIKELKIENERLKTELALAQALLDKQDIQLNQDSKKRTVVCISDDSHAKLPPPENSGSVVHSQIRGNGDSSGRAEGITVSPGGGKMYGSTQWGRRFSSYPEKELCALKFSEEDFRKAVYLIWEDPELRGLPKSTPGSYTLFVPKEAAEILRGKGLSFEESEVASAGELSPAEREQMRQIYGMH